MTSCLRIGILMFGALVSFQAHAWTGEATVRSSKWGTIGEVLGLRVDFFGNRLNVSATKDGESNVRLDRSVDLRLSPVVADDDDGWYRVCARQPSGLYEVHAWAVYETGDRDFLSYRFAADRAECDFGGAELDAYWLSENETP